MQREDGMRPTLDYIQLRDYPESILRLMDHDARQID
jgi:hypothetical protein